MFPYKKPIFKIQYLGFHATDFDEIFTSYPKYCNESGKNIFVDIVAQGKNQKFCCIHVPQVWWWWEGGGALRAHIFKVNVDLRHGALLT